jgi:hypothetical protein
MYYTKNKLVWDTMHTYSYLCFLIFTVNDTGQVEQFGSLSTNSHHVRNKVNSKKENIL